MVDDHLLMMMMLILFLKEKWRRNFLENLHEILPEEGLFERGMKAGFRRGTVGVISSN